MALNATIYKAEINIADNDRHYYGSHQVTVAKHPSETDERLMVRLLAFAMNVQENERLSFTKGLSDTDEPDLWEKDLTGAIDTWIDLGLPDDRRILKSSGKAQSVLVYAYGRTQAVWWKSVAGKVARVRNLKVYGLDPDATQQLAALAERSMVLHFNVQDSTVWVSAAKGEASIELQTLG